MLSMEKVIESRCTVFHRVQYSREVRFLDTQTVNELVEILDQESRVYKELLNISKKKTNIIVEGKVGELENLVKLEQTLVLQMGRIETTREKLVNQLAGELKINASDVTISELLKHLKNGEAEKLKACQVSMTGILDELKNANELNSKLIKNSLDFINFSINMMTAIDSGTNNYGGGGQVNDHKKRNFFDMKL